MGEKAPSENEWMIMEVIWSAEGPVTAADIIDRLKGKVSITPKTVRVMINRLLSKGIIAYHIDKQDARIYHYYAVRSKEDCIGEKRERFIRHYFSGNAGLAAASFLSASDITDEQLSELSELVNSLREGR